MSEFTDNASRVLGLVTQMAPRFRRRFLELVVLLQNQVPTLASLSNLLEQGRAGEALVLGETEAILMGDVWREVFILSGSNTAEVLEDALKVTVRFDGLNERAFRVMQSNQLRLVSNFSSTQRLATQEALLEGLRQGMNPRQTARLFRESIGLTSGQVRAVSNYRSLLESGSREALTRQLRDRRFDSTLLRSIRDDTPLSSAQIDKMVGRYHDRTLAHRATTISRTESLRSVHEGNQEMYRQAVDDGTLNAAELVRAWDTSGDARVRDSHTSMQGQKRGLEEPFTSGLGNLLRFPGDSSAPPEDTVVCRCAVTTRFTDSAVRQSEEFSLPSFVAA